MCGIIGAIPALDEETFYKGLHSLNHRGPDDEGYWKSKDGSIQLGHRRLAILDLTEQGKQPMHFQNLIIVFNGEIFNYLEIKKRLIEHGYKFETKTDTEVILKAYDKWGIDSFHKFNGMWAMAIYNRKDNTLLLCRDRYGIKPLYYFEKEGRFIFASEIQAIHKILGKNYELNREILGNIASGGFRWHGEEDTWVKDVKILAGGAFLTYANNKLFKSRWYHLSRVKTSSSFNEQAEELRDLIFDAIKIRMRSDVSIGTCLSGGVDSGIISSFIKKMEDAGNSFDQFKHQSYCAAFPDTFIDESKSAKRLANQMDLSLDVVNIAPPTIGELEKAMSQCDGPMHGLAFYPIWKLYQHIKMSGITVTLDGQGPDEMLGGYKPLKYALLAAIEKRNPKLFIDFTNTYGSQGITKHSNSRKVAREIRNGVLENYMKDSIKRLINKGTLSDKSQQSGPLHLETIFDRNLHYQFFGEPLPAILQQYDRCSMAHSVECRMPFMDYRIVEFIFSLPIECKVGHGYTKRILREAAKGILPNETRLDKRKIGFNAPIVDWYRDPLKEWMSDIMHSKQFTESSIFDGNDLQKEFNKFILDEKPNWTDAWQFWGAIHIAWWMEQN